MPNYKLIQKKVEELVAKAAFELPPDVLRLLKRAYAIEKKPQAKKALFWIIDNAKIAKSQKLAICQDTGLGVIFLELGSNLSASLSLIKAIKAGLANGYRKNYLRPSIVDALKRGSPTYQGGEIHLDFSPQIKGIKITLLPKGFGSENKARLKMFNPTATLQEIEDFVLESVRLAGPSSCPPFVIGIGIGSTSDGALLLAKKALLQNLNKSNFDKSLRLMEKKILKKVNALNIGAMGFSGKTTALAVKILKSSTHIAGLPVAVNISCHALRRASITIKRLLVFLMLAAGLNFSQAWAISNPELKASREAAQSLNSFTFDFYKQVNKIEGNLFFSPYSLFEASGMVLAGAKGGSANQLREKVFSGIKANQVHASLKSLRSSIKLSSGQDCLITTANALWKQRKGQIFPGYLKMISSYYEGIFRELDFCKQTEASRLTINKWVEDKTVSKIKDLIPKGILNCLTPLVLTNAIYFKGKWDKPFKSNNTKDTLFFITEQRSVEVKMMFKKAKLAYVKIPSAQILEIPYVKNRLSMVVILPDSGSSLNDLETNLSAAVFKGWLDKLKRQEVKLYLPRYKLESAFELKEYFKLIGVTDIFDANKADFSFITKDKIWVDQVIHKAYVEVNEEGTEAAAATAIAFRAMAVLPQEPVVFRADRPFLFAIRQLDTGAVLFIGRVIDPRG